MSLVDKGISIEFTFGFTDENVSLTVEPNPIDISGTRNAEKYF